MKDLGASQKQKAVARYNHGQNISKKISDFM